MASEPSSVPTGDKVCLVSIPSFSVLKIFEDCQKVTQLVKNPAAMQETQIQSLGQEDPLEKGIATHSCFLVWKTLWTERGAWWAAVDRVAKSWT